MSEVEIDVYDYSEDLKKGWWLFLVSGIVSLVIGGMLIFWPGATLAVVTAVIGFFMIVSGLIRFLVAIFDTHAQERWLIAIAGIIGIVLGVIVMKNPESTINVIVLIVAVFWLFAGLVDFFRGLTNAALPDRTLRIVFGLMSALFGIVVLVWPAITIGIFAVLAGIYTAFFGILEILAAFQIKNA
ncbi:MAG: DUF308 domain-containing protein [Actinomycetota bacterium]